MTIEPGPKPVREDARVAAAGGEQPNGDPTRGKR